jgi:diphosphomevalonate decarboxylase
MSAQSSTAIAHPNIAFIKYWGNRDDLLRLPSTGSLSMNLDSLFARTQVTFDTHLKKDSLEINKIPTSGLALERVTGFLNLVRSMARRVIFAAVTSENNFPMDAGIASSAAAYAALSLATTHAIGMELSERELSRLARRGSGSACRSIPTGFVEWSNGQTDTESFAFSIAPPDYWDLVDCIAIVSDQPKLISSYEGHLMAHTSPLQVARVATANQRLQICQTAILERDFSTLAEVSELDCHFMHAVMMTSQKHLLYWAPLSLTIMQAVTAWRENGLPVFYTLDAGPNVHVICLASGVDQVITRLNQIPGILKVLTAHPGGKTRLLSLDS